MNAKIDKETAEALVDEFNDIHFKEEYAGNHLKLMRDFITHSGELQNHIYELMCDLVLRDKIEKTLNVVTSNSEPINLFAVLSKEGHVVTFKTEEAKNDFLRGKYDLPDYREVPIKQGSMHTFIDAKVFKSLVDSGRLVIIG